MPTTQIKFHVLDVGQGACNYIEIMDNNVVTQNLLIDLGTNSTQTIARTNLDRLRQKIIAHNRYLDVLILTHGDTDHYNMIAKILPAFGPPAGNQIGMVRYGGPAWRYTKKRLINILKTYTVSVQNEPNIGSFTPSQTSYDEGANPKWTPIWNAAGGNDEPKLQLIVANTPHPTLDPVDLTVRQAMNGEAVNSKSVVLGLQWNGYWTIATGDATATTFAKVNEILALVDELPTTFLLTLPHHGSRKTTYDLAKANLIPDTAARDVVGKFLDKFRPRALSVSAGEKNHHHPSMYMIRQFSGSLTTIVPYWTDRTLNDGATHFLTSWVDLAITPISVQPAWPPASAWLYATTKTESNVYSTFYFKGMQYNHKDYAQYVSPPIPVDPEPPENVYIADIPMGRNWEFRMVGTTLSVDSTENVARAEAARADFAASVKAPPPSAVTAHGRTTRLKLTADAVAPLRVDAPLRRIDSGTPSLRGLRATE
jgi:hypothetical protein